MSVLLEKPKKKPAKKAIPLAISSEEKKTQEKINAKKIKGKANTRS